jgi:SAM-dependent methyltransferase
VGSGTGPLARLFLDNGNRVFGVEPNPEMRRAGERLLRRYGRFTSVAARAEDTTLPDGSVVSSAGQAFHWFDPGPTRREFARILKPGGYVALIWNTRRKEWEPFLGSYEDLLRAHGTDYRRSITDAVEVRRASAASFAPIRSRRRRSRTGSPSTSRGCGDGCCPRPTCRTRGSRGTRS